MEEATGRDLRWFFDQWVYGAGYPVLSVATAPEKDGLRVTVEQTQPAGSGQTDAFRVSVPWRVGPSGAKGVLDVRRRKQSFLLPAAGPYLRVGDGGGTLARIRVKQVLAEWIAMLDDPDPHRPHRGRRGARGGPDDAATPLARVLAKDASTPCAGREDAWRTRRRPRRRARGCACRPDACAETVADARRSDDEAAAHSAALASDANSYVKAAAARALGKQHAEGAFETLTALLSQDSHREVVRAAALDGLRTLGDRRALAIARPYLAYDWKRGDHHGMRQSALGLLGAAPTNPRRTRTQSGLLPTRTMRLGRRGCGDVPHPLGRSEAKSSDSTRRRRQGRRQEGPERLAADGISGMRRVVAVLCAGRALAAGETGGTPPGGGAGHAGRQPSGSAPVTFENDLACVVPCPRAGSDMGSALGTTSATPRRQVAFYAQAEEVTGMVAPSFRAARVPGGAATPSLPRGRTTRRSPRRALTERDPRWRYHSTEAEGARRAPGRTRPRRPTGAQRVGTRRDRGRGLEWKTTATHLPGIRRRT
jgi:hypothetical protein